MSSTEPAPGGRGPSTLHVPVLLDRVTELLGPACSAEGAVLVDATLGLAGHSLALLRAHPGLRLVGLDRDPQALALAGERLAVGAKHPAFWPAAGVVLDALAAAGFQVSTAAEWLGVSTANLVEFLQADVTLWQAANRGRIQCGLKVLKPS